MYKYYKAMSKNRIEWTEINKSISAFDWSSFIIPDIYGVFKYLRITRRIVTFL